MFFFTFFFTFFYSFSSNRFEFLSFRVVSFNPLPKNGQELDCHYLLWITR